MGRKKTGLEYQVELLQTKKELDANLKVSKDELNKGISKIKRKGKPYNIAFKTNGYYRNKIIKYQEKYDISQSQLFEYFLDQLKDI